MAEQVQSTEETPKADAPATPPPPPKRSLGHRGADPRDTAAELAARAHQISLEAGSKMAGAMRDLIHAAAGISGFVVETARDVTQFMVRRGQLAQDEAERLIREAEEAYAKRLAAGYTPSGRPSGRGAESAEAPAGERGAGGEPPERASAVEPSVAADAEMAPVAPEPAPVTLATTADEPETVVVDEAPALPDLQLEASRPVARKGGSRPAAAPDAAEAPQPARSKPARSAKDGAKPTKTALPAVPAAPAKAAAKQGATKQGATKAPPVRAVPTKGTSAKSGAAVKTPAKAAAKAAKSPSAKTPAKSVAKSAPPVKKAAKKR